MHEGLRIRAAQLRHGLTAFDCVPLGHFDPVHIGIDRQQVVGVAQHDDGHAFGALGDGGDCARGGGIHGCAGGGLDIDAFVASFGVAADDAALHRDCHRAGRGLGCGGAHIGHGFGRIGRICGGRGGVIRRQRLGGTGRHRRGRAGAGQRCGRQSRRCRSRNPCDGDQQVLSFAHGEIRAQTIPLRQ